MTHNKEKGQSIESNPEMSQMTEFIGKDIKTVFIAALYMFKELEERMNVLEILKIQKIPEIEPPMTIRSVDFQQRC